MYAGCSIKEQGLVIWDDKIWFHEKKYWRHKVTGTRKKEENNVKDLWLHKLPQITKKILIIAKI
jgi:hypothetical protein